jgi:hypothetical protein
LPYFGNNLKDPSLLLVLFSVVVMTVLSSSSSSINNFNVQAQLIENNQQPQQQAPSSLTTLPQTGTMPAIKITSHSSGQQVNVGPLTISGTSSDTPSTDCEVYADWNDSTPFGKAIAAGPGGPDDYSKWTFTYDSGYHLIQNGTNNLTSKVSCMDGPTNLTKWNSVNLIGLNGLDSGSTINQAITSSLTPSPASPSSTVAIPLPTQSQTGLTSPSLDPVAGEDEEDEEDEEDNDSDSDDSSGDEENEVDEDNNGSDDENSDSGDEEENGDGDDGDGDDGDGDDGDGDDGDGDDGEDGSNGGNGGSIEIDIPSSFG